MGASTGQGDEVPERRHYNALIDALADGLVELDQEQRIVRVNRRFLEMTGYRNDELVGTLPPHPYWPAEQVDAFLSGTGTAFNDPAGDHNLTLVRKDGSRFPVIAWVSPVMGATGEPVGLVGLIRDMTAASLTEARFRALVSESADLILVLDARGQLRYISPAARRVLGYDVTGTISERALEYVHPDDHATVRAFLGRVAAPAGGVATPERVEMRARHQDGTWRHFEVVATDLTADPAIDGYVLNARDVTERHRIEQALRESEARFRSVVAMMADGLVIYSAIRDAEGTVIDLMTEYGNDAIVAHGGPPPADQVGRRLTDLFPLMRDPERLARYVSVIETRTPAMFEVSYSDHVLDGWFEVQIAPFGDGCTVSFRDVTQRRRLEQRERELHAWHAELERERLADQLLRAQRLESLGRLAAGVAHDFDNSIAAIRNFATVVANRLGDDHPLRADMDQILSIAAQAAELTDELLRFGRRGPGDGALVDPNALVEDVIDLVHRSFETADLTRAAGETSRRLAGPRSRLEQVLVNLLVNAYDATRAGGAVTVRVIDDPAAASRLPAVGFEVRDTGVGMSPEVAGRAFEPFFTTKARGHGTGLGLATVQGIVEGLGGTVRIDSTPGGGTTVLVALPALERSPSAPAEGAAPSELAAPAPAPACAGPRPATSAGPRPAAHPA